eukprot:31194-Pelagococcus_subviridis.AAC.21
MNNATRSHSSISLFDHPLGVAFALFFFARAYSANASLASFCDKIRLSPSANLQHCRKSACSNPVPSMSANDPTSCFSRWHSSIEVSTARIFATAIARVSALPGVSFFTRLRRSSASHASTKSRVAESRASASSYSAASCGTWLSSGRTPFRIVHGFASLYRLVSANSFAANISAACATATRPVKSLCPIMSIVRTPFTAGTYSSSMTSP